MRSEHFSSLWAGMDDPGRIAFLGKLHAHNISFTADQLGADIETLDRLAQEAGLAAVYVTVVDPAGMRDREPGVCGPSYALHHWPRKFSQTNKGADRD